MTWFDDLHQRVADEGQRPHVLQAGDGDSGGGGRLLITEHGARVLACELPGVDHNLFFHTDHTGEGGATGKVTGGDRLWIAPETAYFWPSLGDARRDPKGTAAVSEAIDPSRYYASSGSYYVWLLTNREHLGGMWEENRGKKLHDQRSGHSSFGEWYRHTRLAEFGSSSAGVEVLSFYASNEFKFRSASDGSVAGTWSILQVPVGGTLICPTTINVAESDRYTAGEQSHCQTPNAGPRSYYEPFGEKHVAIEDNCVRFLIDGQRRTKMGVLPEHTTGRMGYYRPPGSVGQGDMSTLIFRSFGVFPGEPYCDLPINHPAHDAVAAGQDHPEMFRGDALQAYNDDGDAFPGTSFGEMEYHDPCVIAGRGPTSRTGSCVTHVMAGPDGAVRRVGRELLGVEVRGIG
ncbi:MAG: hypothetical protein AAFY08_10235 [Planctomycetota bacterium]